VLLGDGNLRYLIDHSPVGTRDLGTLELLQRHGVPSYFSACLTLTLERPQDAVRGDYVCANDVDPEILRAIRSRTRRPVRRATNIDRLTFGFGRRMRKAEKLLRLYAGAACVVTSRLHCALPCIAMGTPVLLIMGKKDDYRFSGLRGFVRHCSREEFLGRGFEFDLDEPGPNGTAHLACREAGRRVPGLHHQARGGGASRFGAAIRRAAGRGGALRMLRGGRCGPWTASFIACPLMSSPRSTS